MTALPRRTARLLLHTPTLDDHADLMALDSDPEVMRFIGDGSVRDDPEEARALLGRVVEVMAERPGYGLVLAREEASGRFVGWGALKSLDGREEVEVGYRLARWSWGRGFATELALALVDHGFRAMGLEQVVGITHPENRASQRVLEKVGLTRTGDDFCYGMAVWRYELPRSAWKPVESDRARE